MTPHFFSFTGLLVIKYIFSRFYKKIIAYFLGKFSECVHSGKPPEVLISEIIEEKFWKSVLNFPLHPILRNFYFDRNKILLICGKKGKCKKKGKSSGVTGDQSKPVSPIFYFKIWCLSFTSLTYLERKKIVAKPWNDRTSLILLLTECIKVIIPMVFSVVFSVVLSMTIIIECYCLWNYWWIGIINNGL